MRRARLIRRAGFALEATLAVLLLLVVLSAAAATGAATMVRTSSVDQSSTQVTYAVDAAADNVMSQLLFLVQRFGVPTQQQLDSLRRPNFSGSSLSGITITQTARRATAAENDSIRSGPYAGLIAQYASYDVDITATDRASNASRSIVRLESQLIPIFQFGVFFEKDLEITAGQEFRFLGRVHTNGDMYVCPDASRMYFLDFLTTPNRYLQNRKDQNRTQCGRTGTNMIIMSRSTPNSTSPLPSDTARLTFDNRGSGNTTCCSTPAQDNRFRDSSLARVAGRLLTQAHGVDSLSLPLPNGVQPFQLTEPKNGSDSPALQVVKYSWLADWMLTIPADQVGSICANLTNPTWSQRSVGLQVPPVTGTVGQRCGDIFTTSTFWDDREERFIRTLDINVGNLRNWVLADSVNRRTLIMYITFTGSSTVNPVPATSPIGSRAIPTSASLPAVRLRNGARLPGAFTLASSHPIYVWGDYNFDRTSMVDTASRWRPASLVGDAISFLSNTWTDANNNADNSNNDPVNSGDSPLFIRAAIAAGHSPTYRGTYNAVAADWFLYGSNSTYGGGLENFPRFLENWSSRTVNLGGSLVSLWYSRYTDWNWGSAQYTPPQRQWSFDTRFRLPTNLPPGTPRVGSVYQIAYRPVY